MKKLLMTAVFLFASPCLAEWTASILGGTDESAVIALGHSKSESKVEFGLSILTADDAGPGWRTAIGPYGAYEANVPGISPGDATSFLGVAAQVDMDSQNLIYTAFAGLLVDPDSQVSPVALYRHNSFPGYSGAMVDQGSVWLAGLRFRF